MVWYGLTLETSGWNKIYCWLCKCAQTKFTADCTNVHKCPIYFIVNFWIIKECFLCLKLFRVFFFVNPGGFFLRVSIKWTCF